MSRFTYIAKSSTGERVSGAVEAGDRRTALVQIERLGLVPITVTEGGAPAKPASPDKNAARPAPAPSASKPSGKSEKSAPKPSIPAKPKAKGKPLFGRPKTREPKLSVRELLMFSRELSDLLQSGMTLGTALNTLSKRDSDKGQGQIILGLRDEIIKGSSLSDALALWPKTFGNLYVSMVRAGEASGHLKGVLRQLGAYVGGRQGAGGRGHGDRASFLFWGTHNVQGLSDRSRGCTEVPSIPPCGGCIGACEPARSAAVGAG